MLSFSLRRVWRKWLKWLCLCFSKCVRWEMRPFCCFFVQSHSRQWLHLENFHSCSKADYKPLFLRYILWCAQIHNLLLCGFTAFILHLQEPSLYYIMSPAGSGNKESACNVEDPGLIPGSGRSPEEGNGNSFQYSCLENSMDRGAWQAIDHGFAKNQTQLSNFHYWGGGESVLDLRPKTLRPKSRCHVIHF